MKLTAVFVAVTSTILIGCGDPAAGQESRKEKDIEIGMHIVAQRLVRGALKDPDSAVFRNQEGPCGEVNSKNSFGGYVGYQRFIAASEKLVILEEDSGFSTQDFDDLWKTACKYRPKS